MKKITVVITAMMLIISVFSGCATTETKKYTAVPRELFPPVGLVEKKETSHSAGSGEINWFGTIVGAFIGGMAAGVIAGNSGIPYYLDNSRDETCVKLLGASGILLLSLVGGIAVGGAAGDIIEGRITGR